MKLHILIGQRRETYPGEFAPEALAVIDDNGDSDNPEYLQGEHKKFKATDEFENLVRLEVKIDGGQVMQLLRPKQPALVGSIQAAA